MGYQSRKRKYTSRRERYDRTSRVIKLIVVFTLIGLAGYAYLYRYAILDHLKTYFY